MFHRHSSVVLIKLFSLLFYTIILKHTHTRKSYTYDTHTRLRSRSICPRAVLTRLSLHIFCTHYTIYDSTKTLNFCSCAFVYHSLQCLGLHFTLFFQRFLREVFLFLFFTKVFTEEIVKHTYIRRPIRLGGSILYTRI